MWRQISRWWWPSSFWMRRRLNLMGWQTMARYWTMRLESIWRMNMAEDRDLEILLCARIQWRAFSMWWNIIVRNLFLVFIWEINCWRLQVVLQPSKCVMEIVLWINLALICELDVVILHHRYVLHFMHYFLNYWIALMIIHVAFYLFNFYF